MLCILYNLISRSDCHSSVPFMWDRSLWAAGWVLRYTKIYLYVWVWTLPFLIHPSLWACMASSTSEPWHTGFSETIPHIDLYITFTFLFIWSQIPEKISCLITTMHQTEQTASASSFRACGALDNRGYLCSWLYLTFLYLLIKGRFFMANAWRLLESFGLSEMQRGTESLFLISRQCRQTLPCSCCNSE